MPISDLVTKEELQTENEQLRHELTQLKQDFLATQQTLNRLADSIDNNLIHVRGEGIPKLSEIEHLTHSCTQTMRELSQESQRTLENFKQNIAEESEDILKKSLENQESLIAQQIKKQRAEQIMVLLASVGSFVVGVGLVLFAILKLL